MSDTEHYTLPILMVTCDGPTFVMMESAWPLYDGLAFDRALTDEEDESVRRHFQERWGIAAEPS